MLETRKIPDTNIISLRADGEISKNDYKELEPIVDSMVEHYGDIKVLLDVKDLDKIKFDAFFEDFKMAVKHYNDFQKIAILGANDVEKHVFRMTRYLIPSKVQTFPSQEFAEAVTWLNN